MRLLFFIMKKRFFIVLAIISLFSLLNCHSELQKNNTTGTDWYANQKRIYQMALKYDDLDVARYALYQMIAINPKDSLLKDTLAILYFKSSLFTQCILLSNTILQNNPGNAIILEIKAISEQNLELLKEALNDYEKLNALADNVLFWYRIAFLQYKLKRYGECENTIEQLLANPEIDKQRINMTMADGSRQIVPLKVAALNMKGVVFVDMNKKDKAKIYFSKALNIFPDFILAMDNLKSLKK